MAIPFDVADAKNRHHRQVLLHGQGAKVAQVLARQDTGLPLPAPLRKKTRVRDAFDDAFAVLVARSRISEGERSRHVADCTVGFVDDERRTIRPSLQRIACLVRQRPIAMDWLFDDDGPPADFSEARLGSDPLPEDPERVEVLEVLAAIDGDATLPTSLPVTHA